MLGGKIQYKCRVAERVDFTITKPTNLYCYLILKIEIIAYGITQL